MPDRLSLLLLGAGLALAALTGVVIWSATPRGAPVQVAVASTTVAVARTEIKQFTLVTAEMVTTREFPSESVPPGAITDPARAVGRTAIDLIPAGLPLTERELVEARGQTGTSLALERGKVLMIFPTTDALSSSKLVQPGDRVDIQATLVVGAGSRATQTIVQNLEVLAVSAERPTLLTFIVDHQTSLVLKHLRDAQAQIDLVVRSRTDNEQIRTRTVDLLYLVETFGIRPTEMGAR